MSEMAPQPPPAPEERPPGGSPPAVLGDEPIGSGLGWSTVVLIGLAIGVGIAVGIGLGKTYFDVQREWGCGGLLLSHAGDMLAQTLLALVVVGVLGGLMLLSAYLRRAGCALLLAGGSTSVTFVLILGNAQSFGGPC